MDSDLTNETGSYYFMLDNATAYPVGNIGWRESDSFDTDIDLVATTQSVWSQPMRGQRVVADTELSLTTFTIRLPLRSVDWKHHSGFCEFDAPMSLLLDL